MIRTNKDLAKLYRATAEYLEKQPDYRLLLKQVPILETAQEQIAGLLILLFVEYHFCVELPPMNFCRNYEVADYVKKLMQDETIFLKELYNTVKGLDSSYVLETKDGPR